MQQGRQRGHRQLPELVATSLVAADVQAEQAASANAPSARWAACRPPGVPGRSTAPPHTCTERPAAAGIGVAAPPSSRRRRRRCPASAHCPPSAACRCPASALPPTHHLLLAHLQSGMATLVCRPGDPQALKAAAAAAAAGASLSVLPLAEAAQWKKLLADGSNAAAGRQLFLVLPDGSTLSEPNAIARYLGGCLLCDGRQCGSTACRASLEAYLARAAVGLVCSCSPAAQLLCSASAAASMHRAAASQRLCRCVLSVPNRPQAARCRRSSTWLWSRGLSGRKRPCAWLSTAAQQTRWRQRCSAWQMRWAAASASWRGRAASPRWQTLWCMPRCPHWQVGCFCCVAAVVLLLWRCAAAALPGLAGHSCCCLLGCLVLW